jgi:hypothetical protein
MGEPRGEPLGEALGGVRSGDRLPVRAISAARAKAERFAAGNPSLASWILA